MTNIISFQEAQIKYSPNLLVKGSTFFWDDNITDGGISEIEAIYLRPIEPGDEPDIEVSSMDIRDKDAYVIKTTTGMTMCASIVVRKETPMKADKKVAIDRKYTNDKIVAQLKRKV